MTAIDRNPISPNLQSPLNYVFYIERAPAVSYYCQGAKVPDVSLPPARAPSPSLRVPYVGDHVVYEPLKIKFKVDDKLQNWFEVFNWLTAVGNPDGDKSYFKVEQNPDYTGYGIYSDITMINLDSQKNATYQITYERCVPTYLSGLDFTTVDPTLQYMMAEATFTYTKYRFSYT